MKLEKLLNGFERAIVSFSLNDYPLSFPTTQFRVVGDRIMIRKPKWLHFEIPGKACMLFHTHNEFVKKIRSVTLYGVLEQKGEFLEFELKKCHKFRQGGLNTLKFIISGKIRTKRFLKDYGLSKTKIINKS